MSHTTRVTEDRDRIPLSRLKAPSDLLSDCITTMEVLEKRIGELEEKGEDVAEIGYMVDYAISWLASARIGCKEKGL